MAHYLPEGPGKNHREGISMRKFYRMFPDDKAAETFFMRVRWPEGPRCPYCGCGNIQSGAKHKTMPLRCRRYGCRKRFSVKVGSVMESSKLGYLMWLEAIYFLTTSLKDVSSMRLHRDLDIKQSTAWFLAHRIRKAFENAGDFFSGPVEIDEVYIRERNKHASKKLKAGRGMVGKTAVVGMKDRDTNRIDAEVHEVVDGEHLRRFIYARVGAGTEVYTDVATVYKGLSGVHHKQVKHSAGEYVNGQVTTNGVESFWSLLRRGLNGTYHKMSV